VSLERGGSVLAAPMQLELELKLELELELVHLELEQANLDLVFHCGHRAGRGDDLLKTNL
jgi:hypothetical protein